MFDRHGYQSKCNVWLDLFIIAIASCYITPSSSSLSNAISATSRYDHNNNSAGLLLSTMLLDYENKYRIKTTSTTTTTKKTKKKHPNEEVTISSKKFFEKMDNSNNDDDNDNQNNNLLWATQKKINKELKKHLQAIISYNTQMCETLKNDTSLMNENKKNLIDTEYLRKKGEDFMSLQRSVLLCLCGGAINSSGSASRFYDRLEIPAMTNDFDSKRSSTKSNKMDQIGKAACQHAVLIASWNAVCKTFSYNDYALFDEIASKVLHAETFQAIKRIRRILDKISDHGVVDILKMYPAIDIISSIIALSRIQKCANLYVESQHVILPESTPTNVKSKFRWKSSGSSSNSSNESMVSDPKLIDDLAHYAIFANVAYGWKMRLLLNRRLHIGNMKTITEGTGIDKENIVETNWKAKTNLPAYFIARDTERKKIVLCIRGTLSARDVLTDLCCTADDFDFETSPFDLTEIARNGFKSKYIGKAHQGMLASAKGIEKQARTLIANEFASHPDYNLVIVGHSLGGGVAAILGTMWKYTFPNLVVYTYGCPCIAPENSYPTNDPSIISIVGEGDPFSTLSLGHLADISKTLSKLCEDESLRKDIFQRVPQDKSISNKDDLKWCYDTYQTLRSHVPGKKLYPPGRILYMSGAVFWDSGKEVTLEEARLEKFENLMLHPGMFDLSRHVPNRYESALKRLKNECEKTDPIK